LREAQRRNDTRNSFLKDIASAAFWIAVLLMIPIELILVSMGFDIDYLRNCSTCNGFVTAMAWITLSATFLLCYMISFIAVAFFENKRYFKRELEEEICRNELLTKEMKRVREFLNHKYPFWDFLKDYYSRREYYERK